MGRAVGIFFEVKLVHRIGADAIRQARQEARHHQAQVARVFRFAQAAPGGVFGVLENLGQIARVGSSCQDSICITLGAVPAMNGQCEAAPILAISPSSSTSCGL